MVFIRDADAAGDLHLVAAAGFPPRDVHTLAVDPIGLGRVRALLLLGADHSLGRANGFRWLRGSWLRNGEDLVGAVVIANRTDRRPSERDLALLDAIADCVAAALLPVARTRRALRAASMWMARVVADEPARQAAARAAPLRPRERTVLELFADGLSTEEVADALVLSRHTVRTHVRNARRSLGMSSRAAAEDFIRRERALRLL